MKKWSCGENVVRITPRENELHVHRMGKSLGGCQIQSGRSGKEAYSPFRESNYGP